MTKILARVACLTFGLATMPAAAYTQTTAVGASACYQVHNAVTQATCVGATAQSWTDDEVDESED